MFVDWRTVPLGKVLTFQRGFDLPARARKPGIIPIISSAGVTGYHNAAMVSAPGVVTGRYGTIGKLFYIGESFWPLNTTLYIINFFGNNERFVYYLLQQFNFDSFSGKSGVPGVNRNDLHNELVCLPLCLSEQRAIATALSDMDALLDGLNCLIAKKRAIKRATMQQLVTGQTRLPGFCGEWKVKRLGDVAFFLKGKGLPKSSLTPFGLKKCIHYGELFTTYGEEIGEVISKTDNIDGAQLSVANDVLMPTSDVTPRGLAKASCILHDGIILGGDILVIRTDPKHVLGTFLSYAIRQEEPQILSLITGTTVFHIYGHDMRRFLFGLPPTLKEQKGILSVLTEMDAEITALETRRTKTRALKQAMMQELLTGRTRLI